MIRTGARAFSTSTRMLSHVGSASIIIPEGTKISIKPKEIDEISQLRVQAAAQRNGKPLVNLTQEAHISGPKGEVKMDLANFVKLDFSENGNKLKVVIEDEQASGQRKMWGTTRSLINNGIAGVSEGHISILKLVGTGYRAAVEGDKLIVRLGFSNPVPLTIPGNLTLSTPNPNRIIIEGVDKQQVKQYAAKIRKLRPPEPYKGKGVFVDGETIKLKQRKIK